MKIFGNSFLRRFKKDQRGQSAVVVAVSLFAIMALAASGIESGHVYYAYRLLLASTRASTLAAAQAMPDIGTQGTGTQETAWYNLVQYSSETGKLNANNLLQSDSVTAKFYCSGDGTTLNVACQTPPSGEGTCSSGFTSCNAVTVTQTAKVPLWFGGVIGIRTFNLTAMATASMRGGTDIPYNIAVIIDTTNSMTAAAPSGDGCGAGATQIQCAVYGLRTMLLAMDPCYLNTTCSASTPYVDGVSLFVFPPLNNAASNLLKDTTCPTTNPTIVPYGFTNVTPASQNLNLPTSATLYLNYSGTYDVVPFNDTYKVNDASTTLQASDGLTVAAGGGGGSCKGLQAPGGEGTYYAQAIAAVQQALVAQQTSYPGSKNVLIILSDGDATSCNSGANTAAGACGGSDQVVALNCPGVSVVGGKVTCGTSAGGTPCPSAAATAANGGCTTPGSAPLNGTGTATTNPTGYQKATYPSVLGMCGQAVQAAQAATEAGTMVYTVAMGSETSGSCTSDRTYSITSGSTYGAEGYTAGQQACQAIGAMASNVNTFFSDNVKGCAATGGNVSYTTIAQIFQAIGGNLTSARLIPTGH